MSPATLSPPPVVAAPPILVQPAPAPAPRLPMRAPLRREHEGPGGLRVTRAGVLASLGIHAILAVLLVVGIDQALRREHARRTAEPREQVGYLDVSQWPSGAPSAGVTAPAGTAAAAAQAVTAA